MGKVLVVIDGEHAFLERRGPWKIGLYTGEDSKEPYGTVIISQEYVGFGKRHRLGRGNNKAYDFSVSWLVENVPEIREAVRQKLALRQQIGV